MTEPRKRGRPATGQAPKRDLRLHDHVFMPFLDAVNRAGRTWPGVVKDFMLWYARQPGAKPPKRPPVGEDQPDTAD